jgi:hypothetical protein
MKLKVYETARALGMSAEDLVCVLVEDYPCDDVNQACARERFYVEQSGALNKNVPGQTRREYNDTHKKEIREYSKIYYEAHKEEINEYQTRYREAKRMAKTTA